MRMSLSGGKFMKSYFAALWLGLMVFQLQLAKRVDTLPITRDYLWEEERRLRTVESSWAEQQRAEH